MAIMKNSRMEDTEEKTEKEENDDSKKEQKFFLNQQLHDSSVSCFVRHLQKHDVPFYNTPVLDKLTPPANRALLSRLPLFYFYFFKVTTCQKTYFLP